jgi:CBS domain-containing protein
MAITQSADKRESGMPGGGAGRKDNIGKSGVYRISRPQPAGDAPIAGYDGDGESQVFHLSANPTTCRDIMTKDPFCCVPADTAAQAARLMKRHDIGALPVVEDRVSKKLIGVVTDRDLALRVVARALEPSEVAVNLVMSQPVVQCSPDDACDTAPDLMEKHRIKRVFVTDHSGRVVGVIAESDIALRLRNPGKTGEVVACISQPDPARV